jgi:uncharacterized protein YecT (DUF1311 family)
MRSSYLFVAIASLAQLAACDHGVQDEAAASRARDSSLSHDLRLANGDTGTSGVVIADAAPSATSRVASDAAARITESPGSVGAAAVVADGIVGSSCASPAPDDQRRCLAGYLARSDVALDKNYNALITALKRESKTKSGSAEPATVLRLRTAQRNWLVYRDEECRKRNAGKEGPLWAPTRAQCLAEYSTQRTQELANALDSRSPSISTAKPSTVKSATIKRTKRAPAKRTTVKRSTPKRHRR